MLHDGLACKSVVLKTPPTYRLPCHKSMLPPASFLPLDVSCLETDQQLHCGFSVQILHFITFLPSSHCLAPLFLYVWLCPPCLWWECWDACTVSCLMHHGSLRAHCLDLTSSIQRTGEGNGSSVTAQPAEGKIWQSRGCVPTCSWKGKSCKTKTRVNPVCQLAWDHRMTW